MVIQQSRVTLVDQENEREERYPQNPSGSETHVNEVNQSPTSTNTTLTTTMAKKSAVLLEFVALRTVPVYLINGTKRVKVNALLDEASSKSYLNSDVAAELGLEGEPCELTVNVPNDNQEKLHSSIVDFQISSLDGKTIEETSAYTTERVTGNMEVLDWKY